MICTNASVNCIDRHLPQRANQTAIIWEGDNPTDDKKITYQELHDQVCRLANALRSRDVKKGVAYLQKGVAYLENTTSNATLPVTMETVNKKLGVKNSICSFTVPLGATINMDGTAIMQGVATVFIAQVFGVDLTITDFLMVILTATLASIGTAGVPGVGLIMLAMVLQQVGLPVEGIALIIGVDRLLDMTRTAVNVTGDAMVSCVVAKSEGEIDIAVYNNPRAGEKDETIDFHHLKEQS